MQDIVVHRKNESHYIIHCDRGIAMELHDYFSFFVPNYKFMPQFRNKYWDGKARLYNLKKSEIYVGLKDELIKFANDSNYTIEFEDKRVDVQFSVYEAEEFIKLINIPEKYEVRDYQLKCFIDSVRKRRQTNLMNTGSGKSLVIYLLVRLYDKKTLIIVPTISLVSQLVGDFYDYGYTKECHKITAGVEKNTDHKITVSTWQSLHKMPKEYFDQYDVVICDEAHLAKAVSITSIMDKLENCKYRFAFTGTLDGSQVNELQITGLFGPVKKYTKTTDLIKDKYLADFEIKTIILKYNDELSKICKKYTYPEEIDFIVRNNERNKFLTNLCLSLKGNTLLLFQFVEKHGDVIHEMIKSKAINRNVYYISGKISGDIREEIRALVEKEDNAIIIASSGTTSTGTNIVNLKNIIFSSPSKSKIRTLQSIGRVLRRSEIKQNATLYDIVDDLSYKSYENYALRHFKERLKIYNEEEFKFKVYNIKLK